jgi:hypothetical protein
MFTLGEGAVSSYLRNVKLNTRSSTETELVGADMYMPEMLWSLYFMESQGYDVEIIELYQDNMSTELMMNNGRFLSGKRTKHIKAKFFFIKDRIDNGEIRVVHRPTEGMWVDVPTKPLQGKAFREMQANLMNCGVDYEAKEGAFHETMARTRATKKAGSPVAGRATRRVATQTLQECVGESRIGRRTKAKDRP